MDSVTRLSIRAADHKALPFAKLDIGFHLAGGKGGNREAVEGHCSWHNRATRLPAATCMRIVLLSVTTGVKVSRTPNSRNCNGDGSGVGPALQYGNGKLTANYEARFFAAGRDQIRLGQDLQDRLTLQRFDQNARDSGRGLKCEDVERIGDSKA